MSWLGAPDDLVGIAVFLASDESGYAIGANFTVDGGIGISELPADAPGAEGGSAR